MYKWEWYQKSLKSKVCHSTLQSPYLLPDQNMPKQQPERSWSGAEGDKGIPAFSALSSGPLKRPSKRSNLLP